MRLIFFALISALTTLLLAACQGLAQPLQRQPTQTFTPFQAASPTPRPTLTRTPTPVPSPTPLPCTNQAGRIEIHEVVFTPTDPPLGFRVYLPPCYESNPQARYPVLYMIHGQTYNDDQWERLGIARAADELINSGAAVPFLIVMPREDDTFGDIYISPFSRGLINGLISYIDDNYSTCTDRACRAIGGLSRGGAWALRLGFTHWELFGSVGLHSTPPFIGDPEQFVGWVRAIPEGKLPRLYLDTGRRDAFLSMTSEFEALLVAMNVPHEWYLNNGLHDEAYWSAHVKDYLTWYGAGWNDIPEE